MDRRATILWGIAACLLSFLASGIRTGENAELSKLQYSMYGTASNPDSAEYATTQPLNPAENQREEHDITLNTVSFAVPAGASVILASLDQKAGSHSLQLRWAPGETTDPTPPNERDAICDFAQIKGRSFDQHSFPLPTALLAPRSRDAELPDSKFKWISEQKIVTSPTVRRFRVPWFCDQRNYDRYVQGHLLAEGSRVRVFAESELPAENAAVDNAAMRRLAKTIVSLAEGGILQHVEQRVSPVNDVDGDGRLSILLCRLSENWELQEENEPVRGCVRGADFLQPLSPFEGDVVYLDSRLTNRRQLIAVLAHELAHAAIFSATETAGESVCSMPNWLNEAIAHFIELEVCPDSPNLQRRFTEFRKRTNAFSVVIPDGAPVLSMRRGPSRAAGCSFLASVLAHQPPHALQQLVRASQRDSMAIEAVMGCEFADLFRAWTVAMLVPELSNSELSKWNGGLSLAGTSFASLGPIDEAGQLLITFEADAMLQVTVVDVGATPDISRTAEESTVEADRTVR